MNYHEGNVLRNQINLIDEQNNSLGGILFQNFAFNEFTSATHRITCIQNNDNDIASIDYFLQLMKESTTRLGSGIIFLHMLIFLQTYNHIKINYVSC